MGHFTLTAIGTDRPGIVAAVTEPLARLRCNVEDAACSILGGHFTMMLILDASEGQSREQVRQAVEQAVAGLGVAITVAPIAVDSHEHQPPTHVLSVYGADHPGIVAGVSRRLADRGVNITDLQTRLVGSGDTPIYAMILELVLPAELDAEVFAADLDGLGRELGVDVSLRELEADSL